MMYSCFFYSKLLLFVFSCFAYAVEVRKNRRMRDCYLAFFLIKVMRDNYSILFKRVSTKFKSIFLHLWKCSINEYI